jgi:hypothetical protein
MFVQCINSIKALFIIPQWCTVHRTPAQQVDMLPWHWPRHKRRGYTTIIVVLAKHKMAPWWWFLREPKHIGATVGILIVLTSLWFYNCVHHCGIIKSALRPSHSLLLFIQNVSNNHSQLETVFWLCKTFLIYFTQMWNFSLPPEIKLYV